MAVKIKNFNKVKQELLSFFKEDLITNQDLRDIGDFTVKRIQSKTRSGKGIDGRTEKKLKELSPNYKKYRKKLSKGPLVKGQVDTEFFRPNTSNLTLTGQMLRALTYSVDFAKKAVKVFVQDTGRQAIALKKTNVKDEKTNAEVAKEVGQVRPFIGIDEKGEEQIRISLAQKIRNKIRKSF